MAEDSMSASTLRSRELSAMRRRLPFLGAVLPNGEADPEATYRAACELIAIMHPPAKEAAFRTALKRIGTNAALEGVALSDIREGIPYSANVRRFPGLWEQALPQIREHEDAYGARVFTEDWPSLSRGRAVAYYFDNHPPRGTVLHVAPEGEAEAWMRANVADYRTLGLGRDNDLAEDLTALPLPDASVDLVICHRVLEHIFDEAAALDEIRRILRPGGLLNVSVPESMHLPATLEWCYPDASHHSHYRQYGADFPARLEAAGFAVEVVRWLLEQPGAVRAAGTYPLRMYNARR